MKFLHDKPLFNRSMFEHTAVLVMKYISTIILIVTLNSCSKESELKEFRTSHESRTEAYKIKESTTLPGTEMGTSTYISMPGDLVIVDDKLVVLDILGDTPVSIFKIDDYSLAQQWKHKGYGPGEIMAPFALSINTSLGKLSVYDPQLNQVSLFEFNELLNNSKYLPEQLKVEVMSGQYVIDNYEDIIGLSTNGNSRFIKYDQEGKKDEFGPLPTIEGKNIPNMLLANVFNGHNAISLDSKWLVVGCELMDKIQIYDLNGNIVTEINGPEFFDPIYSFTQTKSGNYFLSELKESRYGFVDIFAGDKLFYALFSGKTNELGGSASNQGKIIYAFNYQGTFVKQFKLDRDVLRFAVDEKNRKIYGSYVSAENPDVVVFDYSEQLQ